MPSEDIVADIKNIASNNVVNLIIDDSIYEDKKIFNMMLKIRADRYVYYDELPKFNVSNMIFRISKEFYDEKTIKTLIEAMEKFFINESVCVVEFVIDDFPVDFDRMKVLAFEFFLWCFPTLHGMRLSVANQIKDEDVPIMKQKILEIGKIWANMIRCEKYIMDRVFNVKQRCNTIVVKDNRLHACSHVHLPETITPIIISDEYCEMNK
ncbi:MAG: hypothetical protein ACTSRA_00565 [Promethearchaeota archaeon]